MELTGKVIAVLQPKSGVSARSGNAWMTQQYVIETEGQYPKKVVFDVFGEDRIKQFNIIMNERITVHFDIDSNEYNGRWFPAIKAFNVTRPQADATAASAAAPQTQQPAPQAQQPAPQYQPAPQPAAAPYPQGGAPSGGSGDADDLPF